MKIARWILTAAIGIAVSITNGCDEAADSTSSSAETNADAAERPSTSLSPQEQAERAPARIDPAYVESALAQLADLEITAEAMKTAAAAHPDDELLAKFVDRAEKKIPTARKKVEHLQEVARDENIAELQAEIDALIATIADTIDKGAKRAAKLDQMPQREPREPRRRQNDEVIEGDVVDDDSGGGDGGGADDGSGG